MIDSDQMQEHAFHEAGHFAAVHYLCAPHEKTECCVLGVFLTGVPNPHVSLRFHTVPFEAVAIILLAGSVAQGIFTSQTYGYECSVERTAQRLFNSSGLDDRQRLVQIMEKACSGAGRPRADQLLDSRMVSEIMSLPSNTLNQMEHQMPHDVWQEYYPRTYELLQPNWQAITRVAKALLTNGRLFPFEAEAALMSPA